MKVAVTAANNSGLDAEVDSRFGRCPYFAIVDIESMEISFIKNGAAQARGGAGVQAAQLVADRGVDTLISGNIGPKAFRGLEQTAIKVFSFSGGSIRTAIEKLQAGELEEINNATNRAHSGLN